MDVVIFNESFLSGKGKEEFRQFIIEKDPERIIIVPGTVRRELPVKSDVLENILGKPIRFLELEKNSADEKDEEIDVESAIKAKVLELGIQSVRDYVSDYLSDANSLNSEITYTLYRAYFKFYGAALGKEYSERFEKKRKEYLSSIMELKPGKRDILLTSEEDAYWYIDHISGHQ